MNLLPQEEKENIKRGLKLRALISAFLLIGFSFLVGFIMVLPSYFVTSGYFSNNISKSILDLEDKETVDYILGLPSEIKAKLKIFQSNTNEIAPSFYLAEIIDVLPKEVRLNSISFSRDQSYREEKGIVILLSGFSADRDSLVDFSANLKKINDFSSVEVPVSNLTKEKNLPFSISIFIKNA